MRLKKQSFILPALFVFLTLVSSGALAADQAENSALQKGITLFYEKDFDGAIQAFKDAIKANPKETIAYNFLLDALFRNGTLRDYSNELEAVAEEKGEDPMAKTQLGMAYFAKSRTEPSLLDEAMQEFKGAMKIDPQNSLTYCGLGMVYFDKRMMPRAKAHFLKALQLNPCDILAMELTGNILLVDEKKPEEALALFQKITEICPTYPDAWYFIGSADYDLGRDDEAAKALKQAMALDPEGLTQGYYAPILLGDLYLRMKQYPEAVSAYEAALKINSKNGYVRYKIEKARHPEQASQQ